MLKGSSFSTSTPQFLFPPHFCLMIAILVGLRWNLIVVLIAFISLMTDDDEYLFLCPWPSSLDLPWRNVYSSPLLILQLRFCCCWVKVLNIWMLSLRRRTDVQISLSSRRLSFPFLIAVMSHILQNVLKTNLFIFFYYLYSWHHSHRNVVLQCHKYFPWGLWFLAPLRFNPLWINFFNFLFYRV